MPKCKVCKTVFKPKYNTLEQVCSVKCAIIYAKEKERIKTANLKREENKKTKVLKENLKTLSEWKNDLQKEINTIVRLIDKDHLCISSQKPLGKSYDAGHMYSRGAHPHIRYHLFNIWAQSVHDNQYKSGNQLDYVSNLELIFGTEIKDYCLSLKSLPPLHITIEQIKETIPKARSIIKWLKLQDRQFTLSERIELRKRFNIELNIY
jgi:hypothetical protein